MDETKHSSKPPNDKESQSFKQAYAGTFVGQRKYEQEKTVQPSQEGDNPEGEPMPVELKRAIEWIKNPVNHNAIIAGFTALIFVATFAYAVIATLQWCAMLSSNETNREALVSVQRAFISAERINPLRMYDPPTKTHYWKFKETFNNYGNTEAKQATHNFELKILPDEPTEEQFLGNITRYQFRPIAPKQGVDTDTKTAPETDIFAADLGEPISAKLAPKAVLGQNLFVWGWVVYRDIFPNTKRHVTEFCGHSQHADLLPTGDQHNPFTVSFTFSNCYTHNCQDDECADYERITNIPEPR